MHVSMYFIHQTDIAPKDREAQLLQIIRVSSPMLMLITHFYSCFSVSDITVAGNAQPFEKSNILKFFPYFHTPRWGAGTICALHFSNIWRSLDTSPPQPHYRTLRFEKLTKNGNVFYTRLQNDRTGSSNYSAAKVPQFSLEYACILSLTSFPSQRVLTFLMLSFEGTFYICNFWASYFSVRNHFTSEIPMSTSSCHIFSRPRATFQSSMVASERLFKSSQILKSASSNWAPSRDHVLRRFLHNGWCPRWVSLTSIN